MGRRPLAVSINASSRSDVGRLAEVAYAEFGRIDILVNNAGMSPAIPSHDVKGAWFNKILARNLEGPFRLPSSVAKRMIDGDGGAIVNVWWSARTSGERR